MYRGPRDPRADYFDDYLTPRNDGGVLGGLGLADFDRVSQQVVPEGAQLTQLSCNQCGKKTNMLLDWHELFIVGCNGPGRPLLLPEGWGRSEANADCYCQVKCSNCPQGVYAPHFTPEEARNLVHEGLRNGHIQKPQLQQWENEARMYAARMSGG